MTKGIMLGAWVWTSTSMAAVYLAHDDMEARGYLGSAMPGDTVLLAPGEYDNLTIESRTGVTLRSQFASDPAVIVSRGDAAPALYIGQPQQITVADIVIDFTRPGAVNAYGINVDRQPLATFGQDLTLRNITIRQTAPIGEQANTDAMHISGVRGFVIENCRLENWGQSGAAIDIIGAYDGLIRNNYLQGTYVDDGTGITMKGGARNIVVRANRMVDAGQRAIAFGGQTDLNLFEEGIRFEARDLIAEGNVIVGGYAPIAFVSSIGGEFRHNFSYKTDKWLGRILMEQWGEGFPTKTIGGKYLYNKLVWEKEPGDRYPWIDWSGEDNEEFEDFTFIGNQWYRSDLVEGSEPSFPPGTHETGGIYGVDPQWTPDQVIPWRFEWGIWLVNASQTALSFDDEGAFGEPLYLAMPGPGAEIDLAASSPLIGAWTFQRVDGEVLLEPMSDRFLVAESYTPEPAMGVGLLAGVLMCRRRRMHGQARRSCSV